MAMKILVLDNYDSFTYNLVYLIRELGYCPEVCRNDRIAVGRVDRFDKILLSPGPGIPSEAGIMNALIREYGPSKSILGVCLGHQAIAEVYGAEVCNLPVVQHATTSEVEVRAPEDRLFHGLPQKFTVAHYHSWSVIPQSVQADLRVTATNASGVVMALAHRTYDVRGVQFHPESVMTQYGKNLLGNWIGEDNK